MRGGIEYINGIAYCLNLDLWFGVANGRRKYGQYIVLGIQTNTVQKSSKVRGLVREGMEMWCMDFDLKGVFQFPKDGRDGS